MTKRTNKHQELLNLRAALESDYQLGIMLRRARDMNLPDPEGFTRTEYERQAKALDAAIASFDL